MGTTDDDLLLTRIEQELRLIAREHIARQQLPSRGLSRMWGAYGTGQLCALCDKPIQPNEVEYEIKHTGQPSKRFDFISFACPRGSLSAPGTTT
jgi:hypothetical protein